MKIISDLKATSYKAINRRLLSVWYPGDISPSGSRFPTGVFGRSPGDTQGCFESV